MVCFNPQHGYAGYNGAFTRKRPICRNPIEMTIPCGSCQGCVDDRINSWRVRMMCEALFHDHVVMGHFTYNNEHLPGNWSLNKNDYQAFLKRLRHFLPGRPIGQFVAGEYGEQTLRPHYHIILFGVGLNDFPDLGSEEKAPSGNFMYQSKKLNSLWGKGMVKIGNADAGGMGYAAGYCGKKMLGQANYERRDTEGHTWNVLPEFGEASRRPAIGRRFFETFGSDFRESAFLVFGGKRYSIPDYFRYLLRGSYETKGSCEVGDFVVDDLEIATRKARMFAMSDVARENNTPERLKVREELLLIKRKGRARDDGEFHV